MNRRTNKILSIAEQKLREDLELNPLFRVFDKIVFSGFRSYAIDAANEVKSKIPIKHQEILYICGSLYKLFQDYKNIKEMEKY